MLGCRELSIHQLRQLIHPKRNRNSCVCLRRSLCPALRKRLLRGFTMSGLARSLDPGFYSSLDEPKMDSARRSLWMRVPLPGRTISRGGVRQPFPLLSSLNTCLVQGCAEDSNPVPAPFRLAAAPRFHFSFMSDSFITPLCRLVDQECSVRPTPTSSPSRC